MSVCTVFHSCLAQVSAATQGPRWEQQGFEGTQLQNCTFRTPSERVNLEQNGQHTLGVLLFSLSEVLSVFTLSHHNERARFTEVSMQCALATFWKIPYSNSEKLKSPRILATSENCHLGSCKWAGQMEFHTPGPFNETSSF